MIHLDFAFFDWKFIQSFILKGFAFSIELTLVAMLAIGCLIVTHWKR